MSAGPAGLNGSRLMKGAIAGVACPGAVFVARHDSHTDDIVHVVGSSSPEVREHVLALTSLLSSWGYSVSVVGEVDDDFARELSHAHVASASVTISPDLSLRPVLTSVRALRRILNERSPVLVHAHGMAAALHCLLTDPRRIARPMVCSPNLPHHQLMNGRPARLQRHAYGYVLRHSDAIISLSEVQRREIQSLDSRAAERAVVVPYGVDARRLHDPITVGRRRQLLGITPTAAVVGCVADQMAHDDLELFLDAAANICSRLPNLEFVVICADPDDPRYHAMAHERGLLGATVFVRPVAQFNRLLTPLNVLAVLQPGWPGGQLALQALVHGLGVVAVSGGEVEEMLMDNPGVTLARAPNAADLAEAIIQRLELEAERVRSVAGEEAPVEVSQFLVSRQSWDLDRSWQRPRHLADGAGNPVAAETAAAFGIIQMARRTVAVYHQLLDRRSPADAD
ncbi:MAG: glycosyltransferase family 4 protein [Armatimonadetes bacterium]|nr:glycosyltransferase family 4 protein [Armatimonadota bacterium]